MFLYQEISFNSKDCFLVPGIQEASNKVLMKGTFVFLKLHCSSLWSNFSQESLSSIFPKPSIMNSPSARPPMYSFFLLFLPQLTKGECDFTVTGEEQRYPSPACSGTTKYVTSSNPGTASPACHTLPTATPGDQCLMVVPRFSVMWISFWVEQSGLSTHSISMASSEPTTQRVFHLVFQERLRPLYSMEIQGSCYVGPQKVSCMNFCTSQNLRYNGAWAPLNVGKVRLRIHLYCHLSDCSAPSNALSYPTVFSWLHLLSKLLTLPVFPLVGVTEPCLRNHSATVDSSSK